MDTRIWGKDGWKLYQSIAYGFSEEKSDAEARHYKTFFEATQFILPCIYCRRSYKKYIEMYPIDVSSRRALTRWLYTIHNCVNDKLRKQGYSITTDPMLKEIDEMYKDKRYRGISGFTFLCFVLFNYTLDMSERRKKGYLQFFESLQYILPCKQSRERYKEYIQENPLSDAINEAEEKGYLTPIKRWCHSLERCVKVNCCSYKERCDKIEQHRVSKCSGETCRK